MNKDKKKKFITCTLPYANSVPHIGHAFEFILGDALTRYFRGKLGDSNVHFNLGLDEHGKKIYDAAISVGKTPIEFLDELNGKWKEFCARFCIEYNSFYKTSNKKHYELASRFWIQCQEQGLIYKKKYSGNYCVGCESFKLDKDLENGKCPDHPTLGIQKIEEENYFFALTKFKDELILWSSEDIYLKPSSKIEELKNIIDSIEDISISRIRKNVPWGIPVPNDPEQTIYIWYEALTNYFLILGYYDENSDIKEYWKDSVQIFGPDNLKFQAVIFQAMLKAANLGHTTALLCHGTILDKEGKKMSKTVGNVIDPIDQLNKYGIDAVRYYALSGLQVYGNSVWSEEQLVETHNAHLADNYGNLLTRVVHLINLRDKDEQFDGCNYTDGKKANYDLFEAHIDSVKTLWENYDVTAALHKLNDITKLANQYITEKAPWSKDAKDVEEVLSTLYWVLEEVTLLYLPVIPNRGKQALESLYNLRKEIVFPKISLIENVLK